MRRFAIVLLSFGVIGGFASGFASMHRMHHGGCGYSEEGRWVPGHFEPYAEKTVAPAPAPAPLAAPAPQIIVVQPQAAPSAPPTIVVQPAPVVLPAAPAVKTETAKPPASE
jgi:hypothetical protein